MEYPQGTNDLYELLGADKHGHEDAVNSGHEHVLDMPVETHGDSRATQSIDNMDPVISKDPKTNAVVIKLSKLNPFQLIKSGWPYLIIFFVALFFYLILFTNFSVLSYIKSVPSQVQTNVAQADKPQYANIDAYNAWIRSYFYEVNDPAVLDPATDLSGNGLSNYQKFVLGLNPKKKDTMGLGMTDTQALLSGINPLTGSPLNDNQKKLIADYIDLESVANKLALQTADNTPKVAGATTASNDLTRDGIEINTNIPAQIDIPKLKISVPLIWTKDTKNFDTDLAQGVVHYPGTALPGDIGTAYISGHSSNYSWAKGSYNKVFETLDGLKQYDSFSITATDVNGKKVTFHYVVTKKQVYAADDQAQFISQDKSIVALSTCWPIGTSAKRLVVFGELSQTDK
ncbi:MAG: putative sortase [Candidatus Doudnabacteria bacterium]|nr:putative sortase [Candidatus Doudnabacteria bacterium]